MFAIIDIETTGGRPSHDRITEIAVVLHDGNQVIKQFSSLVNPYCSIPYHITRITGITNEMVKDAPGFHEIAKDLIEMTEGAVFVAHSVNFDYGFVKAAFHNLGYNYQRKTLCTVRLSRSTFTGLPSYSLGNLCQSLNIEIKDRHRALGDAAATAILFDRILKAKVALDTADWLPKEIKKTAIPPQLPESVLNNIPEGITGVYYFYNEDKEVIYVGKSIDIKKRMLQHFSISSKESKKSIQMKKTIADISYENTGNDLIALLLESDEIKKLRPEFNHSQKRGRLIPFYGIFQNMDSQGYFNLVIERLKEGDEPLSTADNLFSAKEFLYYNIKKYNLCQSKCGLHNTGGACFDFQIHQCKGACIQKENPDDYNQRAKKAIEQFSFQKESFISIGKGRDISEKSLVLILNGQYKGFGYIDVSDGEPSIDDMLNVIKKYQHNRDIQTILCSQMKKGYRKIVLNIE